MDNRFFCLRRHRRPRFLVQFAEIGDGVFMFETLKRVKYFVAVDDSANPPSRVRQSTTVGQVRCIAFALLQGNHKRMQPRCRRPLLYFAPSSPTLEAAAIRLDLLRDGIRRRDDARHLFCQRHPYGDFRERFDIDQKHLRRLKKLSRGNKGSCCGVLAVDVRVNRSGNCIRGIE
jgi:hypothetical protein